MGDIFGLIILLLYLIVSTFADDDLQFDLKKAPELYEQFIKRHNRKFKSEQDYNERFQNFVVTLRHINTINAQSHKTQQKVLPNQFADFSNDERRRILQRTTKNIDPELKQILRIKDNPNIRLHDW